VFYIYKTTVAYVQNYMHGLHLYNLSDNGVSIGLFLSNVGTYLPECTAWCANGQ